MRAGPPGHNAAERNQTRVMDETPTSIGRGAPQTDGLGPEAEAWIDAQWQTLKAAGTPVSKRFLRQRLVREWEREAQAEDATAVVTFLRSSGEVARSVAVDLAVGELVARTA